MTTSISSTQTVLNDFLLRGAANLIIASKKQDLVIGNVTLVSLNDYAYEIRVTDYSLAIYDNAEKIKVLLPKCSVIAGRNIITVKY